MSGNGCCSLAALSQALAADFHTADAICASASAPNWVCASLSLCVQEARVIELVCVHVNHCHNVITA